MTEENRRKLWTLIKEAGDYLAELKYVLIVFY